MTKRSNRRRTRKALLVAGVIVGLLTAGLLLTSGPTPHRATSLARTGEGAGSGPSADHTDSGASMPDRPTGGYGFGGSSLMGLRVGVADGPSQGNLKDPNDSNDSHGSNDSNGPND